MTSLQTVTALKRLFENEKDLWIWDYDSDFNDLWNIGTLLESQHSVVVWVDTPIDLVVHPVATDNYLTPFDWALAARSKFGGLRITVLDLRSKQHDENKDYTALQWWRTQNQKYVTWLRRITAADLVAASTVEEVKKLLVSGADKPDASPPSPPEIDVLRVLRSLPACQVDTGRSATHHDIANLVGPLLLLPNSPQRPPNPPDEKSPPNHQKALRQVLMAAEIIGDAGGDDGKPINIGEKVRLVLVDDQWRHGWAEWLAHCLGLEFNVSAVDVTAKQAASQAPDHVAGDPSNVSLWVVSSADWLLNRVESVLKDKEKGDTRFALRLSEDEGERDYREVLLLDLRLAPQGSAAEKQLAQRVAKFAPRFANDDAAWPRFDEKELQAVTSWVQGAGQSPEPPTLLTLLARLVAHVDPTLPIVLFSSTGRRDIIDKLKGFESIFTQFQKPHLLLGYSATIAEEAKARIAAALDGAGWYAASRRALAAILHSVEMVRPIDRVAPPNLGHFELYLDESGSSSVASDPDAAKPEQTRFVVAGLLVGYQSAFDPTYGPDAVQERMAARGLRWWPEHIGNPYLLKQDQPEEDDLPAGQPRQPDDILNEFHGCLGKGNNAYGICVEYRDTGRLNADDELRAHWRSDNRYRAVLSVLLEIVLYEVLPGIVSKRDSTLSVFVATRVRAGQEFKDGEITIRRLKELYGYEPRNQQPHSTYLRSLTESAVLPLILQVIERRGGREPSSVRLEHARGVTLAYPKFEMTGASSDPAIQLDDKLRPIIRAARPAWKDTRHQHYLADIVARLCRWHGRRACDNASSPNLKNLFMRGVYDTFDGRLQALLRAARALDHGDRCSAILEIVGLDFSAAFARRSGAAVILRRITDAIRQDLRGDEIAVLARNMKLVDSGEAISALDGMEAGAVVKFIDEKGYGFIRREAGGNDVFFHISAWRNATYPSIGETVVFKSYVDGFGKEKASFVQAAA